MAGYEEQEKNNYKDKNNNKNKKKTNRISDLRWVSSFLKVLGSFFPEKPTFRKDLLCFVYIC